MTRKQTRFPQQNNRIHQRRSNHTCLSFENNAMPSIYWVPEKFMFVLWQWQWLDPFHYLGFSSLGGRRREGRAGCGGDGVEKKVWLADCFLPAHSEISFVLIAVCHGVRRQITKTVILPESDIWLTLFSVGTHNSLDTLKSSFCSPSHNELTW